MNTNALAWQHALWMGVVCSAAVAQDSPNAPSSGVSRSLAIVPTLDASVTAINGGSGGDGTDLVTQIRPGVNIASYSGRVRGTLNYSLDAVNHSRSSQAASLQNSLNATLNAEAVPNWAYIDATANISRRALSAYGTQLPDGSVQSNSNVNEVGTLSLAPYVKGQLGSWAVYEARLLASATNTRHSTVGDSSAKGLNLSLNSASGQSLFGWGLQGSRLQSAFRAGRSTENDRVVASLRFQPDYDLNLTLRGGQEATDVASINKKTYNNWGLGATWTPSPRTAVNIDTDHRYFGQSFRVTADYRTALTSLRFSSTRDASTSSDQNAVGLPQTWYQRFFVLFASREPDPVLRDLLVLEFLRFNKIDPNALTTPGFVTSSVTLQRRDELTFSYAGKRTTVSLGVSRGETSLLDTISSTPGDGTVRQMAYTLTASHRLTPTAGLNVSGSRQITLGNGTRAGNSLKSLSVGLSDQLGLRLSGALSARYASFSSPTGPYRETSVSASVGLRF